MMLVHIIFIFTSFLNMLEAYFLYPILILLYPKSYNYPPPNYLNVTIYFVIYGQY